MRKIGDAIGEAIKMTIIQYMRKGSNLWTVVYSVFYLSKQIVVIRLYVHREYLQYTFKLGQISILYQPIRETSKESNPPPLG